MQTSMLKPTSGTSLHVTSENGHVDIARLLLDHGADPKARGRNQETAFHLASREGDWKVARLILERGAEVDAEDDEGEPAYQIALNAGYNEIAQSLSRHSIEDKT